MMLVDIFVYYNWDIFYKLDDFVLWMFKLGIILICLGWGISLIELLLLYIV